MSEGLKSGALMTREILNSSPSPFKDEGRAGSRTLIRTRICHTAEAVQILAPGSWIAFLYARDVCFHVISFLFVTVKDILHRFYCVNYP